MRIQTTMDNFPMLLLDLFKEDLKKQGISADIQVGGEDTVFVGANIEDAVKAQVLVILCDKYHFAKGLAPLDEGGGENSGKSSV